MKSYMEYTIYKYQLIWADGFNANVNANDIFIRMMLSVTCLLLLVILVSNSNYFVWSYGVWWSNMAITVNTLRIYGMFGVKSR